MNVNGCKGRFGAWLETGWMGDEREMFWIFMQSGRGYWKRGVYREESGSFLRGKSRFMPGKVGVVIHAYNYALRGVFMHKQAKGS